MAARGRGNGELFDRWREDFKVIYLDVQDLAEQRDVYREVLKIAQGNPRLEDIDGRFFYWLARMHSGSAVLAVRKQIDRDTRAVSLRRLLEAIAPRAEVFTRAEFVGRAAKGADTSTEHGRMEFKDRTDWYERTFDELVGAGANRLPRKLVQADIDRLDTAAEKIKRFANTTIAHRERATENAEARAGLSGLPTWDELNGAIDTIMELTRKYNALLDAGKAPTIVPVYQWNWTAVFRLPWIEGAATKTPSEFGP